ncbi:MAG TPA: pyridoxal-dependent decarboxylase [Thermoanaerobaculia bacterium]|nr:pyridoxal-dependent decarboxylase [Thermoanaerobaculia bacterium]
MSDPFQESTTVMERAHELARLYVSSLASRSVARAATPEQMAEALDEPLPESASDPAAALEEWLRRAEPGIVASAGPRFFGFVVGGVTPAALGGDWLASALDQCGGLFAASPAAAQTELVVLRWLKELFNLPREWPGTLTSGATMANLVGIAAARQWAAQRLGFDAAVDGLAGRPAIPVIAGDTVHMSVVKSLGTLGLGRSCRRVPAPEGRVDVAALGTALAAIEGPAIVLAGAGEVNTGAFDDLAAVAELCAAHEAGAWLHVDAAFGLFAGASPRLAHLLRGIERADSVAADGHKWLNVPYDCGFAFVRDRAALRGAFATSAPYVAGSGGFDADDHGPEMSRRFRALAAWCALKAYGRDGYRVMVERCVENASAFARWVKAARGLELLNEPSLNVVCFRYAASDDANRAAVAALQADGRVFVTGTVWGGRAAIRAAFDNWATAPADVEILERAVSDIGSRA